MKKRINFIAIGIILILICVLLLISLFFPKIQIKLNGDKIITINVGEKYTEYGASANLKWLIKNKELDVKTTGEVLDKIGSYYITYEASYKNYTKSVVRTVNVVDQEKPVIKLNKEITGCKKNKLLDIDATVTDNVDGDLTKNLKYRIDGEKIELYVTDSSKNTATYKTDIKYVDNEKPKITLNGSEKIYLTLNEKYTEFGAKANDSCDGDITDNIKINGIVDSTKEGTYKITYSIVDSDGNKQEKIREVIVSDNNLNKVENGTIYLTFDDGPGKYTEEFLKVLDKYNVKATFFVTNQFPKYQYLIKEEYNKGHTVGIHTYSHKWSIYSSVDTYLNDFNQISSIVYNETGAYPKIFRFPGGSSNTVSRRYCVGIMSKLSKLMEEKGYTYFDWSFDSGDTSRNKNSKEDIIKTVKSYLKGNGEYIILMHDLKKNTLDALPSIIEYAKNAGYKFAPITESTPIKHFKIAN